MASDAGTIALPPRPPRPPAPSPEDDAAFAGGGGNDGGNDILDVIFARACTMHVVDARGVTQRVECNFAPTPFVDVAKTASEVSVERYIDFGSDAWPSTHTFLKQRPTIAANVATCMYLWCFVSDNELCPMGIVDDVRKLAAMKHVDMTKASTHVEQRRVLFQTSGIGCPSDAVGDGDFRLAYRQSSGGDVAGGSGMYAARAVHPTPEVYCVFWVSPSHELVTHGQLDGAKWIVSGPLALNTVYPEGAMNA